MIKIIIYEDRSNLRDTLRVLLSSIENFVLLATFPNCKNADKQVLELRPDVVIMDIDMPEVNGIIGTRMIKEVRPETQVLMLTVFEDDEKIFAALKEGANGYLLKKHIPDELINAIHNVTLGGAPMSPGVAVKVLHSFHQKTIPAKDSFKLSKRELEILELLVKGNTYKRIASDSFVSIDTVRSHIKNIYIKLHVNCATEAVAKALRHKIVDLD